MHTEGRIASPSFFFIVPVQVSESKGLGRGLGIVDPRGDEVPVALPPIKHLIISDDALVFVGSFPGELRLRFPHPFDARVRRSRRRRVERRTGNGVGIVGNTNLVSGRDSERRVHSNSVGYNN